MRVPLQLKLSASPLFSPMLLLTPEWGQLAELREGPWKKMEECEDENDRLQLISVPRLQNKEQYVPLIRSDVPAVTRCEKAYSDLLR